MNTNISLHPINQPITYTNKTTITSLPTMTLKHLLLLLSIKEIIPKDEPALFYLQTKTKRFELTDGNLNIINNEINTILLIHGWGESAQTFYYETIPNEYFKKGDYNMILVDWSKLADDRDYVEPVMNARIVGNYIAEFIINLHQNGMNLAKLHIIGVSLGAHVSGFAGKKIQNKLGIKILRITALEPAGPGFERIIFNNDDSRLAKTDANMVDVLHTTRNVGLYGKIGSVDFYANSDKWMQPSCGFGDIFNTTFFSCGHRVSIYYYTESINSNNFIATDCKPNWFNWCRNAKTTIYGDNTPINTTGVFYFDTNSKPPYAKG